MALLPDETFNMAVTSPPYYWIRDYGYDGQLGHEKTVDAYIEQLMKVFDEVKRVLHPLRDAFHEAVEDYIETCAKIGKEPQKGKRPVCPA